MKTNLTPILNWFQLAKPDPTIKDACVQVGCHYEEVVEMLEVCNNDDGTDIRIIADNYKLKEDFSVMDIENIKHFEDMAVKTLDSLCDQIVTATGVAYMLGMDIQGALDEVNKSNWSKFENGKPVFNEQGKIGKGKDYFKPDLSKFIKGE